jgi:cation diffusion facilitator family transporter
MGWGLRGDGPQDAPYGSAVGASFAAARRVAVAGIAVSAALACVNVLVGVLARSTSVVAIGVEFAGDVLASSVVLVGIGVAARPADDDHPYGHGRVETLAAFTVGVILAAGGVAICYRSLHAIGVQHPPPDIRAAAVLVLAIVLRAAMSAVKFSVGTRARSAALLADAWNDAVDILSAAGALTAVLLARYDPERFLAADHYGGFVVGVVVVVTGIRVGRDASLELMDTMPPAPMVEDVRRVAAAVPGVVAIEKLFARKTGLQFHVDVHVEVDPEMTVAASHDVATRVRITLKEALPWIADVLVHVEPHYPQDVSASRGEDRRSVDASASRSKDQTGEGEKGR